MDNQRGDHWVVVATGDTVNTMEQRVAALERVRDAKWKEPTGAYDEWTFGYNTALHEAAVVAKDALEGLG